MRRIQLARSLANENVDADDGVGSSGLTLGGQALIVQNYATPLLAQPTVSFELPKLKPIGEKFNSRLSIAKGNAKLYLDDILPGSIKTVSDIEAYYTLHKAIATEIQSQPKSEAIKLIYALIDQAKDFESSSKTLATKYGTLRTGLLDDASVFAAITSDINALVNGNNGALADFDNQISDIDSKMAWAIAGAVLSGLAVIGGAFMIVVGAVAGFVTAGTSTPLIVSGAAIVALGVAGAAGSGVAIASLCDQKTEVLTKKAQLQEEVRLASGLKGTIDTLLTGATQAADASQSMANAWSIMGDSLGNLASNLDKGKTDIDVVRRVFLKAAEGNVVKILQNVDTIKEQLTGVKKVGSLNQDLGAAVRQTVNAAA